MRLPFQKLSESAIAPTKAHKEDAGFDLYSAIGCTIGPLSRFLLPTHIAVAIPNGFYGQIFSRSGNALKKGYVTLAGVVDSGFRGDIGVIVFNIGESELTINRGDKVAQLVILPCPQFDLDEVQSLDETARGAKGFGSSGG